MLLWGDYFLSSARLWAQVCHDCVVVATSVRTELILLHRISTMEKVRNVNSRRGLSTQTYELWESSSRYTTSFFSLSPCLTIVAGLRGYEGVKSTVDCWPAALCSSGAMILSIYVRKHRWKERHRRRFVNTYRHSNTKHKMFIKFIHFTVVFTTRQLLQK